MITKTSQPTKKRKFFHFGDHLVIILQRQKNTQKTLKTKNTYKIVSYKTGKTRKTLKNIQLAVRKGFEPLMQFPTYTLSRRAPSTTRTPYHSGHSMDSLSKRA